MVATMEGDTMIEIPSFDMDIDFPLSNSSENIEASTSMNHMSGDFGFHSVSFSDLSACNELSESVSDEEYADAIRDGILYEHGSESMEYVTVGDESDHDTSISEVDFSKPKKSSRISNKSESVNKTRRTTSLTLQDLERCYSQPLSEASQALNLSATMLKKICRGFGIKRWPHRQLHGIEKTLAQLKCQLANDTNEKTQNNCAKSVSSLKAQITELENKKEAICRATSSGFNPSTLNARRKKSKKTSRKSNIDGDSSHRSFDLYFGSSFPQWKQYLNRSQSFTSESSIDTVGFSAKSPAELLLESQKQALRLQERSGLLNKMMPIKDPKENEFSGRVYQQLCDELKTQLKTFETSPKDQLLHLQKHIQILLKKNETNADPQWISPCSSFDNLSAISENEATPFSISCNTNLNILLDDTSNSPQQPESSCFLADSMHIFDVLENEMGNFSTDLDVMNTFSDILVKDQTFIV